MAFLMDQFGPPNFHRLGYDVLVVEIAQPHALVSQAMIWQLHDGCAHWPEVLERVPGFNNLTIRYDRSRIDSQTLQTRLTAVWTAPAQSSQRLVRTHEIPVQYGGDAGPDLASVAARTGRSEREVIELHSGREYRAYFLGFQPGFAYMGDLDPALVLPRLAQPRARVPAGCVAIAESHTAVYPFASPGGWHLIGRTDAVIFDPSHSTPALFAAGDIVRFVEAR